MPDGSDTIILVSRDRQTAKGVAMCFNGLLHVGVMIYHFIQFGSLGLEH